MATTTTVPAYMAALRDALNTRFAANPTFAGVQAFAAPAGDPLPLEMVEFFGTDDTLVWAALGNRRVAETYTLRGMIGAIIVSGAGEEAADQARARVYAIFTELFDLIRTDPNMGHTVMRSSPPKANLTQGIAEEGRWAALEITIDVYTELNS